MKLPKIVKRPFSLVAKKLEQYTYAKAGKRSPVPPTMFPASEHMGGRSLADHNLAEFHRVNNDRIEILSKSDTGSGYALLIDQESIRDLVSALDDLMTSGFVFRFYLSVNGSKLSFLVRSTAQLQIFKNLFRDHQLREVLLYKNYQRSAGGRIFGREFALRLRPVREKNGWLLNIDSDVGNSPIEIKYLQKANLPSTMDVTFKIDAVYTWVDGSDESWIQRKSEAFSRVYETTVARSNTASRWENRDELKYSLRSLALHAPWINNVYIVTDSQVPAWLNTASDRVFIVDHKDIFPAGSKLPTFNSHAIESVLHRIEGLAEHFIYINDDVLFGAPTSPDDFFTPGGLTKAFFSRSRMPIGNPHDRRIASEWGGMNASKLIELEFGKVIKNKMQHTPRSMRRSVMSELESKFNDAFACVRNAQFRTPEDIAPASLYSHYSVVAGTGISATVPYTYLDIGSRIAKREIAKFKRDRRKVLCVNDTDDHPDTLGPEAKNALLQSFLDGEFPWPSPWENVDNGEMRVENAR